MKLQTILSAILTIFIYLSITACGEIKGEALCGIWQTNSQYGKMKIEITPWKGKFHGYMLEYENGANKVIGKKTEDYIVLYDLIYKDNAYQNGTMLLEADGEQTCSVSLRMTSANQLTATYNCEGHQSTEIWVRKGHPFPKTSPENATTIAETSIAKASSQPTTATKSRTERNAATTTGIAKKATTPTKVSAPSKIEKEAVNNTSPKGTFYVIGIQKTVAYEDIKALEKTMESLWNTTYNEDFSGKLNNISDQENMYVTYSKYDDPKGKMTITIGYQVKDLTTIPSGLHGVQVMANEYYVSPLSGNTSDYEGEAWKHFEELVAYRKATSVDFEVYKFDSNYEVTEASIWIASK